MASLEEIRSERIKKLELLKAKGVDPYPIESKRDVSVGEAVADFTALSKRKKPLTLAGRVMAVRRQGGLVFLDLEDGTGKIQGLLKKDDIGADTFDLFVDAADIGDFIEIKGSLFVTKRKEKTLMAQSWHMLSKSLRPLPAKWHGLQDVEERFRKRYLDLLSSPEVKNRFLVRSQLIAFLREQLGKDGYVEVETPILQDVAGGATAEPFKTHHNALDIDLYLRIAPELYLKRLIVGGIDKVFEIGRNFRNEGIDVTHNPEFTMLEFYEAYGTASSQMDFVEKLIKAAVKKLHKGTSFPYDGNKIETGKPFAVISYADLLKRYALIPDPDSATRDELVLKAQQLGITLNASDSREKIMDAIYKKVCRPKIIQPTFIVDYPAHYLPLAKRNPAKKGMVDAFQLVIGALEVVKAFSELNDPLDQAERFAAQEKDRQAGDKEAQAKDDVFIEAIEYGMPPTGGVGIGIDRLTMLLTDATNIREVVLFPTLRPKG
jgi:lysyl-tRNA synthetase class 2